MFINLRIYLFLKCLIKLVFLSFFLISCDQKEDPAIEQINAFIKQNSVDKNQKDWRFDLKKPPQVAFSKDKKYLWELTTNHGVLLLEFMPEVAPMHISSTIYLTNLGFYDGLGFHRIIKNFMAQGGDPVGNGSGGPGYRYAGEFDDSAKHNKAGILSMANAGKNTDGSQFFITFRATPHLNGKHTVFGQLVEGMPVLKILESIGARDGKPTQEVKILSAKILVK